MESMFGLKIFDFDIILNYYLFSKFKLIRKGKYNHLINTLTVTAPND